MSIIKTKIEFIIKYILIIGDKNNKKTYFQGLYDIYLTIK